MHGGTCMVLMWLCQPERDRQHSVAWAHFSLVQGREPKADDKMHGQLRVAGRPNNEQRIGRACYRPLSPIMFTGSGAPIPLKTQYAR